MARKRAATQEEMLALREQGLSNAEIAEKLGISYATVHRHIGAQPQNTIAQTRRKVATDKEIQEILKFKEKGLSNYQIGSIFGVSEATIHDRLKKAQETEILPPPEPVKVEKPAPVPEIQPEVTPISAPAPSTPKKRAAVPIELRDFAYIPEVYNFYSTLICQAMPEPWAFKESDKETAYPGMAILTNYIRRVFKERALEYNSCADEECDKIILFHKGSCYIHTGLYTPNYKGLYLVFERNRNPNGVVPWYCRGTWDGGRLITKGVYSPPEHRCLSPDGTKPFNPNVPITTNTNHVLEKPENRERFPESIRNNWNLPLLFETAVELARRKARIMPQIAVQCFKIDAGPYFLLPLYLTNPEKPDLAAIIEDVGDYYYCRTAITPQMAYLSARLNGRPTVDWLTDLVEPVK